MTAGDDAFWREQEQRLQRLEQPCCTQSSMSWSLVDMPGDLVVVIHGESDCLNCFFRHLGQNTTHYYGTRLSERQLISGDTEEPLRRLLHMIARERQPEAVLVLSTCPVELSGGPFESVVRDVSEAVGVPMRALRTHGLALMSQTRCQDWLCAELASLAEPVTARPGSLNIVGLPRHADVAEVAELLAVAGLTINGSYPNGSTLADWRAIGAAAQSFVVDREMFPRLCERLTEWKQPVVEVPLPIGVDQSASFYRRIGEAFSVQAAVDRALAPRLLELRAALSTVRRRCAGRRLAICVRMVKTHRSDRLAYDGLGELPMLQSLGFDLGVLVQGPPEAAPRRRFAQRLAELGHEGVPFDVFEGPWRLGEQLRAGGFEIALMSDVAQNVVEQAGVRMIPAGALKPLLAGVPYNLRLFSQVI